MKRKLILLLMISAIIASITACGGKTEAPITAEAVTESIAETQKVITPAEPETEIITEAETETEILSVSEAETDTTTTLDVSFESLGISIPIPESWTLIDSSTDKDITDVQYSCGIGTTSIRINQYLEDIADMSGILIDAALSNFQKDNTYKEITKNDVAVDGKNGRATAFYYRNDFCFLTAISTGRSIVTFLYRGTTDASEELDEYSKMVDNTKFEISNSEDIIPENTVYSSTEESQPETEPLLETEPQAEYVEKVWIPNSGSKYHRNSSCSNMNSPTQVSRSDAERMGYTPCKRCY